MIKFADAYVTDALPAIISDQPWARAYAQALKKQIDKLREYQDVLGIWKNQRALTNALCDYLAAELQTPQYNPEAALPVKQSIDFGAFFLDYFSLI